MKKKKILNIFTYDYPLIGNDNIFIHDEVIFFSKKFKKVNIIPIKKGTNNIKDINGNVNIDYSLIDEIYNIKKLLMKVSNILCCKYLWIEILNLKYKNYFRKIKMLLTERYLAESIYQSVSNKKNCKHELFYSFWSNHTLLAFYFLKKKNIIMNSFSRILGSDLKGFIPNDDYIPFKKIKFLNLDFVLILNEEQKKILSSERLINKKKIYKNYLGINLSSKLDLRKMFKKQISFASCGSLIHVKNTIEIINFISVFSRIYSDHQITYFCIGVGSQKKNILKYAKNNLPKNVKFKYIEYVPSLVDFLKKHRVNYFMNFSLSEGMSFAVMEALSCSIPVICSNIPGNTEIIKNTHGYILKKLTSKEYVIISKNIINDIDKKKYLKKRKSSYLFTKKNLSRDIWAKKLDNIVNRLAH